VRLLLQVNDAIVCSVQLQWTDLVAPDPEIVIGEHRALFRVADLLGLARLLDQVSEVRLLRHMVSRKGNFAANVKEKTPHGIGD